MKVKALKSFGGKPKAIQGQVIEVDAKIGRSLIAKGYAEEVKTPKRKAKA